ncbi:MAG: SurA N-terminal domain-containing protein, partial [Oscillospiraceae bacterium]
MNKIKNKKLIIVGILGLICVALVLIISQFSNNYVIKVNGNPVYNEEFEMLAESNKMLYEENIRQKNNIPDEM